MLNFIYKEMKQNWTKIHIKLHKNLNHIDVWPNFLRFAILFRYSEYKAFLSSISTVLQQSRNSCLVIKYNYSSTLHPCFYNCRPETEFDPRQKKTKKNIHRQKNSEDAQW